MNIHPAFLAYAVTSRPGHAPSRLRIGAAFPRRNGSGLTVILNALPLRGRRIIFLEPPPPMTGAPFFPPSMPTDLATRLALRGEKRVWEALYRAPFPPGTRVFYNCAPKACRRRADFLILHPQRGIIAIEVKGGRIGYRRGLRQRLPGQRWHKRIEPWLQVQRAIAGTIAALNINPLLIPQASMLAMPGMKDHTLPFSPGPHMLTADDLSPTRLAAKLNAILPPLDPTAVEALAPALERITQALTPPSN